MRRESQSVCCSRRGVYAEMYLCTASCLSKRLLIHVYIYIYTYKSMCIYLAHSANATSEPKCVLLSARCDFKSGNSVKYMSASTAQRCTAGAT